MNRPKDGLRKSAASPFLLNHFPRTSWSTRWLPCLPVVPFRIPQSLGAVSCRRTGWSTKAAPADLRQRIAFALVPLSASMGMAVDLLPVRNDLDYGITRRFRKRPKKSLNMSSVSMQSWKPARRALMVLVMLSYSMRRRMASAKGQDETCS
jgi:hypothetical protein